MLRVSSPGLRCFRHPQQSLHARWLTQATSGKAFRMDSAATRTQLGRHHGRTCTEHPTKTVHSRRYGVEARRKETAGVGVEKSAEGPELATRKGTRSPKKATSVGPIVAPVHPVLKIYLSCACSGRYTRFKNKANSCYTSLEASQKTSSENSNETSSRIPDTHHAGPVRDVAQEVFTSLFEYENQLPLHHRRSRHKHLRILATTNSFKQAWSSYLALTSAHLHEKDGFIPWQHLHRIVRLIASTRPRVRAHFECLLQVLSRIHETGGKVQTWEWNILIDAAGKGLRKTTKDQFQDVLSVYNDFLHRRSPGASLRSGAKSQAGAVEGPKRLNKANEITMSTILHLASRTNNDQDFDRAVSLLNSSGVQLDRITYLTVMERHTRRHNLQGVRMVMSEMRRHSMEPGVEGWTLYMWALARLDQLEQAEKIFTALRCNGLPQLADEAETARTDLEGWGLNVPKDVLPDEVTYTAMVQAYAYRGYFRKAIETFHEMVKTFHSSSNDPKQGSAISVDALLPVYRAMFLGYSRHSQLDAPNLSPLVRDSRFFLNSTEGWSLSACQQLLNDWLRLPHKAKPNPHTLYWILKSLDILSGGDPKFLKSAIERLEKRFGVQWGGRLSTFVRKVNDRLPRK